ncbi:MAG TPA: type I DNA topoisomerase [Candidatus Gracilibacteria bacterium]
MSVKNLVIVESPAKAKTIEKFLGKDFVVKSSFGHIRDLPKKEMGVDIANDFKPNYVVSDDKKKVIAELKKAAKDATVWLASDEDREGEAIAWHLAEALGLDSKKTKRIVFHEITKGAITAAVENPRTIDQNLVDAQQARRVLDRLVGYELSPVLWQKIKGGLSAGRVQSVAVRVIVEREREIASFEGASVFKVVALFESHKQVFKAELPKKFEQEAEAHAWMEKLIGANFTVSDLQQKPGKKSPSAPFTTSTLQQEASRKLGFSVKQTMSVAQKLYESGKITYMRTDSLNLSDIALEQAKKEITANYGKEYLEIRKYKTKSSGAQEAHEAIRPTDLAQSSFTGESQQQKLYDLIWKRTIASQMAEAKLEKTVANIEITPGKFKKDEGHFIAEGEVIKFDGFLKVYLEGTDDEEDKKEAKMLPILEVGQVLEAQEITAKETYPRPPSRYTEASLVKQLEQMGIGRPSTYAPTISTVQDRGYIEKRGKEASKRSVSVLTLESGASSIKTEAIQENFGAEKNKLFPTDIGGVVTDFLVKHFAEVVDYGFTAKVEEEFDMVAEGKHKWNVMISGFYTPFHKLIEKSSDLSREEANSSKELGVDPTSGKPVIVRIGRFGPMIQIGTKDDEEKPRFASIPDGESMETITLEVALEQFKFPKVLGKSKEGEDISVGLGKFGPYVKEGKVYASLKKKTIDEEGNEIPGDEPTAMTLKRALELLKEKKEQQKNRYVSQWPEKEIEVLRGPYGIYIKAKKKNIRIPKSIKDPEKLTLEECEKIIKGEIK